MSFLFDGRSLAQAVQGCPWAPQEAQRRKQDHRRKDLNPRALPDRRSRVSARTSQNPPKMGFSQSMTDLAFRNAIRRFAQVTRLHPYVIYRTFPRQDSAYRDLNQTPDWGMRGNKLCDSVRLEGGGAQNVADPNDSYIPYCSWWGYSDLRKMNTF
jgi:hypothetical protein